MVLPVIKYIDIFSEILNLEGHQNCCIGSKVMAILLNKLILPTGGVASGRVCTCIRYGHYFFPIYPKYTEDEAVDDPDHHDDDHDEEADRDGLQQFGVKLQIIIRMIMPVLHQ